MYGYCEDWPNRIVPRHVLVSAVVAGSDASLNGMMMSLAIRSWMFACGFTVHSIHRLTDFHVENKYWWRRAHGAPYFVSRVSQRRGTYTSTYVWYIWFIYKNSNGSAGLPTKLPDKQAQTFQVPRQGERVR